MAFIATCWRNLFGGAYLDLPGAYRQRDLDFVRAVCDVRFGVVSKALRRLVKNCQVQGAEYDMITHDILHLMPRHRDVVAHNRACLRALTGGEEPLLYRAVESVELDPDRNMTLSKPAIEDVSEQSLKAALTECIAPPTVQYCLRARVMMITNRKKQLGVRHGSAEFISIYQPDGTAVVRMENHVLPAGVQRGSYGRLDAGDTWVMVACPPVKFFSRLHSCAGALAVRTQVPFVLGWASTILTSQSWSTSRAVLDLAESFNAGMDKTTISRVPTREGLHIISCLQVGCTPTHLSARCIRSGGGCRAHMFYLALDPGLPVAWPLTTGEVDSLVLAGTLQGTHRPASVALYPASK